MTKYYCDRCKNETRGYFRLNITHENETPLAQRNLYDCIAKANKIMLCDDCINQIFRFLGGAEID